MNTMKRIDVKEGGYERRLLRMKEEQEKMVPVWREISKYISPNRGRFDDNEPNQGDRKDRWLLDATPSRALATLQAGMQGGLTSPSRAWFQLTLDEPELASLPPVMRWLDDVQEVLSGTLSQSNIYNCLHGIYGEIGAFGIGAIIVDEDQQDIVTGNLMTAGEYYASFDARGTPDSFGRQFWMTIDQMAKEFGADNLSERAKGLYEDKRGNMWTKVWHLVRADDDRVTRFPWISLYWEEGQQYAMSVRGYHEFPVLIPRWEPVGSDYYGYGPGWLALGESRTLQEIRRDYLIAQKKNIDPPVVFPMGARADRPQLYPGAVNYASDPDNIARPIYQVQLDIAGQLQAMADSRNQINQEFYADLFMMIAAIEDNRRMTATEVDVRQEEKLQMLGPVIERLEHELLNPLIGRVYMILQRRGLIPAPPEELAGRNVNIEYISMLALAQKASAMGSVNQLMSLVAGLAGMAPEVIDKLDVDEVLDQFVKLTAVPAALIRPDDQVAEIRMQRQQQQEQARAMMEASQIAQTVKQGTAAAKDLATSPAQGGGNVLDALVNGMGGGGE